MNITSKANSLITSSISFIFIIFLLTMIYSVEGLLKIHQDHSSELYFSKSIWNFFWSKMIFPKKYFLNDSFFDSRLVTTLL